MDADDYRSTLLRAHMLAIELASFEGIDEALRAADHAESFGCFIDPTAWIANIGKLREDSAVLRLISAARSEAIKAGVKPRVLPKEGR